MLLEAPYPALRIIGPDGAPVTAFLATQGKLAVKVPSGRKGWTSVTGSLIVRGRNTMIAVSGDGAFAPGQGPEAPGLRNPAEIDLGPASLIGEILDAKCWFGAMRPGFGPTHKSCAALCARGGLPLAFCRAGACATDVDAPLFLDAEGRAHGRAILPLVAEPVLASGRMVRVGDVHQFRVAAHNIQRL